MFVYITGCRRCQTSNTRRSFHSLRSDAQDFLVNVSLRRRFVCETLKMHSSERQLKTYVWLRFWSSTISERKKRKCWRKINRTRKPTERTQRKKQDLLSSTVDGCICSRRRNAFLTSSNSNLFFFAKWFLVWEKRMKTKTIHKSHLWQENELAEKWKKLMRNFNAKAASTE